MKGIARYCCKLLFIRPLVAIVFSLMATISFAAVNPMEKMEGLVMPGDVVQGHARFETKCDKCHEPFKKAKQSKLCRDCHEQIDEDIKKKHAFHGKLHDIANRECHTCHTDHKGRDMDIIQMDEEVFDHSRTEFKLKGDHRTIQCSDCHKKPKVIKRNMTQPN